MFRVVILTTIWIAMASVAQAQWVSSGSGVGAREGDQGLTSPDNLAQSLGYDDSADMEEAAAMGYESNSADAEAWGYATNDNFDEDCVRLFGTNCEEVDASEFRPIVPQIITCIDFGFVNLTEMDAFVDAVSVYGGDENDAANCKRRDYSDTDADGQLCMMATNDSDNASACRAALGVSESSSQDCSDMDRDDYENLANNMPPRIVTPADWSPAEVSAEAGQGSVLINVLRAEDPDGDTLTWSLTASNPPVFAINPSNGTLSLSTGFGQTVNGPTRPDRAQVTVQVSDGVATDDLTLSLSFADENGPPRIITPADWTPSDVANNVDAGAVIVDVLAATDPDGDTLTWSLASANPPIFAINPDNGQLSLGDGVRPETAQVTVQVSDGELVDDLTLTLNFEAPNGPPQIIVPADWTPTEIPNTAGPGDAVISILRATDPDEDPLTWSITSMEFDVFSINAETGIVTIADGSNAPETQPDSISLTVQVSDGELTDNLTVRIDLQDPNRPPQIVLPADWVPSIVAHDAAQGASLIDVLAATDPDDDALTWSISASDMDIFSIDAQSGVLTLAREDGLAGLEARPEKISVTVQVSDGQLTDEQALVIPLEAEKINNPPEIIVPEGFAENEFNPYANTTMVGTLKGRDPDGDTLTWSLLDGSPEVFNINAQTGAISYTGLGANDKLSCEAANSDPAPTAPQGSGGVAFGIVSSNSNTVEDHNMNDFRSKKTGGTQTTTNKYHVFLERSNHRGGSFTTEARNAQSYDVTGGANISVPQLRSATVNSNVTPINSYLVYQNNAQVDFSNKEGVVTFTNPIIGIYYTDNGFDSTIASLGKPGALYSRKSQQNKLGLEGGRDIAWIDPIDSRKLRFRSRTANVGDFMRVITTASNTGTDDEDVTAAGPDICSATVTVQLSDGQETDEETLTLAFGDPNRAPAIIMPMDWVPSLITNDKNANDRVVSVLASRDPDGDTLRWSLSGQNANMFIIDTLNGNISLAADWNDMSSRPTQATVTVNLTDGRLSDAQQIDFSIEEKASEGTMSADAGTNGSFQFVSGNVQNIFNQDFTIMARFYHGSDGYTSRYFQWWPKKGWKTSASKETLFFYGGNDNVGRKVRSGVSLHVMDDSVRLQMGTDYNYLETRTKITKNRWHTVMFVVDASRRQKTGNKAYWPIKIFLNGQRLAVSKFKTSSKNGGYAPVQTASFAGLGVAGKRKTYPNGNTQNDSRRPWARHLPLRASSFIHEVSIWQGDKSGAASAIYNSNRDVTDYASTSAGAPRYSWKPALWGKASTSSGQGTLTLSNLANGSSSDGGPLAGNGSSRLDGDMHLYPGRFTKVNGQGVGYTDWQSRSPQGIWHQGMSYYFDLLRGNGQRNWQPSYNATSRTDVETFTTGEMNGKTRSLD